MAPVGFAAFVAFAALAFVLVKGAEAPRPDDMQSGGSVEAQVSSAILQATETLQSDPHNVEALNVLVHFALLQGNLQVAMQHFQSARIVAPRDKEVVAHGAALAILVNMADRVIPTLEQLLADQPEFAEGHWWMAVAQARGGNTDTAREHLLKVGLLDPNGGMGVLAQDMLQRLDAPPPVARVSGSVVLADGVSGPVGAALYVAALGSETGGGPPVAAQRLGVVGLPSEYRLGDANLTFGGSWPESVWLRARLDLDGDPMTRDAQDLESVVVGPVSAGTEGLELVLGGE